MFEKVYSILAQIILSATVLWVLWVISLCIYYKFIKRSKLMKMLAMFKEGLEHVKLANLDKKENWIPLLYYVHVTRLLVGLGFGCSIMFLVYIIYMLVA